MIKKRKKKKSLKKFVFLGLFFCLIGGLAYFLVWSPFFWVGEIKVEAADGKEPMYYSSAEIEEIAKRVLEEKIFYFIPLKSVFLAPTEEIEKRILERFPEIRLVNVLKKMPSVLEIKIEERVGIGIWCRLSLSGCFKIDREGVIFRESPLIGGNLVLNIYGENNSAKIRDEVIPPRVINFILTAQKVFPDARDFEFVSDEELKATTIQGWQIYFNPSISAISQIDALKVILKNETEEGLAALEYVDLRIEGRVYYK